jgi:hypothetical protein
LKKMIYVFSTGEIVWIDMFENQLCTASTWKNETHPQIGDNLWAGQLPSSRKDAD